MSNNQVTTTNSLIALKCMRLPTNHTALPMRLSPYPKDLC